MTCKSMHRQMIPDVSMPKISDNPPTYIRLVALDVSALSYKDETAPILIDLTDYSNKGVSAHLAVPHTEEVLALLKDTYGHRYSLLLVHDSVNVEEIIDNLK